MREKLIELLDNFQYDLKDYIGNNKAFVVDNHIELADHLIANGVTIPVRCGECKHWMKDVPGCTEFIGRCEYGRYMIASIGYCLYGERRTE